MFLSDKGKSVLCETEISFLTGLRRKTSRVFGKQRNGNLLVSANESETGFSD